MRPTSGITFACASLAALLSLTAAGAGPDSVNRIIAEQLKTEDAAKQSQLRIAQLDDETTKMLAEYRRTLAETDSVRRYNQQLSAQIQSQQQEMDTIAKNMAGIEDTNHEIYPLMQRMLETLDQFVKLDIPFLPDERRNRIAQLKDVMGRADVSTAEKYRHLMEAYQIEMDYGRTIESYEGKLGAGDEARTVDFLRLGRVALLYQTLDGKETGYWDVNEKKWVQDDGLSKEVAHGLKVAKKQSAPDVIVAPVPAPQEVKS